MSVWRKYEGYTHLYIVHIVYICIQLCDCENRCKGAERRLGICDGAFSCPVYIHNPSFRVTVSIECETGNILPPIYDGLCCYNGPFQYKDAVLSSLTGMANIMLKERRPAGRLFFNMELPIQVRRRLYIETGP